MKLLHNSPIKKRIIIILGIIIAMLLIMMLSVYLFINSLIHKMNIVTAGTDGYTVTEQTEDMEPADEYLSSEAEDLEPEAETDIPETSPSVIAKLEDKIEKNMEENQLPIKYDKDVLNVLLIGSDTRKSGGSGRSDAMILVSINKNTKKIIVTSILRDVYLKIPGRDTNNRINAAYAYGGADLLMETIEQNFRIKIDQYASIDFYAFIDIVDAVGGVTLDVTEEEIPVINNYISEINRLTEQEETKDCLCDAGTLLLNGKQALGYARNRYVGNSDFERTARQRRVLEQVYEKIKDLSLVQIKDLLNIILPQVTTNLTEGEIFSMILSMPSYINYDIEQWSIPKAGTYTNMKIRGMAVLGIDFADNISELRRKVYGEE